MSWKDLPGIREREIELRKIELQKKKLDLQYFKACLMRHFPEEMRI